MFIVQIAGVDFNPKTGKIVIFQANEEKLHQHRIKKCQTARLPTCTPFVHVGCLAERVYQESIMPFGVHYCLDPVFIATVL